MKYNVGGIDRKLRIVVGLLLIAAGIYFQSWWGGVGVILLLTGVISWCPAYSVLGISTKNGCCHTESKSTSE